MNSLNRHKLINIILITLTCVVILICVVISLIKIDNTKTESDTPSDSTTVAYQIETDSETLTSSVHESNSAADNSTEVSTKTDITFSSDEEIYNYAVSQINQKKYYSAIKYLRKIPGYKDADALQTKTFKLINTDYFELSADGKTIIACEGMNTQNLTSDKVTTRSDSSIPNSKIAQRGEYWYLDTDGVFHTVGIDESSVAYKTIFLPILNYNKSFKFDMIAFEDLRLNESYLSATGSILRKDGEVSYFYICPSDKWGACEVFGTYKQNWLGKDEKVIYISDFRYALSNKGNLLHCPLYNYSDNMFVEWASVTATNLVAISDFNGEPFLLSEEGTVAYGYNSNYTYTDDYYPALKSWNDIISINNGKYYCCGLTSDGKVLVALKGVTNSLTPFSTGEKIVAITANNNIIAALTEKGTVYTYTVPDINNLIN